MEIVMSKSLFAFVFFATGWGPTEGGINAVNFDLCNAMGDKSEEKSSDIYCVFSGAEPLDQEKTKARMHNVTLFHVHEEDFNICNFDAVFTQIHNKEYERIYWVGHDTISGRQALECKNKTNKGKIVLFHHMHYIDYYGVAKSADVCEQKDREQRRLFCKADYAIAVGPQLYASLVENLVVGTASLPKCGQVIPGLADIMPINGTARNPMTVLFTGRLEEDNDPIKQFTVPLLAVSDLVKEHNYTTNDITIKLIGLKGEEVNTQAVALKNQAYERAGRVVNVLPLKYTTNRDELFDTVKRSIVTVMPSISEGFGLAGYESIAAGVPIIISRNSGLYKFLQRNGLEKKVYSIDVTGDKEQDVQSVKECIYSIVTFLPESKKKAIELRDELVKLGYFWEKTAEDTYSFLLAGINKLSISLKAMISDKACQFLAKKESSDCVLTVANNYANRLVENLKVDKQIALSKSIDKLYSIKNGYNTSSSNRMIVDCIKSFLEEIVSILQKYNASHEILINFTNNNSNMLANEPEENTSFSDAESTDLHEKVFKKNFKKEIKDTITSLKINAVVTEDDEEVIKKYHKKILTNPEFDTIDFRGVSVVISDDPTQSKVKLKDIYVPIALKGDSYGISDRRNHAIDSFESCDRLIIVGDPGSGKSTYLKNKFLEHCSSNSERMCVFIRIADFVKRIDSIVESKNEYQLAAYIESVLDEMPLTTAVHQTYTKLKSVGGVDYYIDGLDEVQDSKKKENVNRAINEFIGESTDCKFFITSRKIGLDIQPFNAMDFVVREIAPLSSESIEQYVENWYSFISKINQKNYKDRIEKLKTAINQDKALCTLASNPLLLSIIAILHYHGKQLPNNKATLYKTITETLLQTWIEHRNFTVLNGLQNLDNQDLTNIFSRAAYWMIENKYGEMAIGEGRLGTIYEDYCDEKKKGIKTSPKKRLLEYISQDAGIVVNGGEDDGESLYQFLMHRQFAEYYAAMELDHKLSANNEELRHKLTKILDEPKWTEVSILMCDHLHASGEGGDVKVQNYIAELFNIKSKPIEDFQINIQLILKWIINGVILNEGIMQHLFERLDNIFRSKNRFRVIQFSGDIVRAFADSTNTWYQKEFCNFIKSLIDSNDYAAIRNVAVILNLLLQHKTLYKNILNKIGKERMVKALKFIVEDKNFYMLVRWDGCYNTIFKEQYIACVNRYFESSHDNSIWINYTSAYVFAKFAKTEKGKDVEKLLQKETKLLKHDIIRDQYIHCVIFWKVAVEIATNVGKYNTANFSGIDIDKWDCRAMIDSAISIKNDEDIGTICSNYVLSYTRLYHLKKGGKHVFTVFLYNRDNKNIEKHQIILPLKFNLKYLRKQIEKEDIKPYLSEYIYLDDLKKPGMTTEELKILFDQALVGGRLLTGEAWNQIVVDKIAESGEVFYKYFDVIKREIGPREELDISHLKGEYQIYFKYLFAQRVQLDFFSLSTNFDIMAPNKAIKIEDKELIISLYEQAKDEEHKAVLYEILYNLRNIE